MITDQIGLHSVLLPLHSVQRMKFSHPRPPRRLWSYFSCSFFRFKLAITIFFYFSSESTHHAMTFPEKNFWYQPKAIFLMIFQVFGICRHFVPPFALVSSRRDVASRTPISLKPSDLPVSFSIAWKMYLWKCVRDMKKNISMHKIPFFGKECPIKKKRRKR